MNPANHTESLKALSKAGDALKAAEYDLKGSFDFDVTPEEAHNVIKKVREFYRLTEHISKSSLRINCGT